MNAKNNTKKVSFANIGERVVQLPLSELYPPDFHPFLVSDDMAMKRLTDSVRQYGVREPGLARHRIDGGYELLAGNRRKRASELAGLETLPVIIRELTDDEAVIAMVDSNLEQRECLLPSEKAWAYRLKLEALNHNGVKGETLSVTALVGQTGDSKSQIFRIVRLTELVPDLLDKVDAKQLAFNPAVELSYLSRVEQAAVVRSMERNEVKPSLSQAVRLKKQSQAGKLSIAQIDDVMSEDKSAQKPSSTSAKFSEFFPVGYTEQQMDTVITELLAEWNVKQTSFTKKQLSA